MSRLGFLLEGLGELEVRLRLSELRVLVALRAGWDSPAKAALDRAVVDLQEVEAALEAVDRLPALQRRRVLAAFGALNMPGWYRPARATTTPAWWC